ncbi:hypothetical protein RRG08_031308 [Elysia crispata]|uniref:DUF4430 domain-containing protein n=1 Tax=Elysia crispata TaxID=231223 RepID=A0AAE0YIE8_9GAST|nr:hypothetical protein RRG08_031308 [Elysia crispata]
MCLSSDYKEWFLKVGSACKDLSNRESQVIQICERPHAEPALASSLPMSMAGSVFIAHIWACGRRDPHEGKPHVDNKPSNISGSGCGSDFSICCHCGENISLIIEINNQFVEPFFNFRTEVQDQRQRELINHLEQAATQDKHFRFVAQYWGSLGYFITTINDLAGSTENKTYWHILSSLTENAAPVSLNLGVSSYIPNDEESIIFNFTTWATQGGH